MDQSKTASRPVANAIAWTMAATLAALMVALAATTVAQHLRQSTTGDVLPAGLGAGFVLGAGFAASIGPQNLYLVRAGLMRHHLFPVTAAGLMSEFMLLGLSVLMSGVIVAALGSWRSAAVWLGAGFLVLCGWRILTQHNRHGLDHLSVTPETRTHAVATMLFATWCNPMGYLKWAIFAGVLLGQPGDRERLWCIVGLALASLGKFALWPFAGRLLGHVLRHRSATLWFNRASGAALIASAAFVLGQA